MKSHFTDRRLSKIPDLNRKWDLANSNRNATLILLIFYWLWCILCDFPWVGPFAGNCDFPIPIKGPQFEKNDPPPVIRWLVTGLNMRAFLQRTAAFQMLLRRNKGSVVLKIALDCYSNCYSACLSKDE